VLGRTTAIDGDSQVVIWEAGSWQQRSVVGDVAAVRALAAAPHGDWLANASDDSTVRIWDPVAECMQARIGL